MANPQTRYLAGNFAPIHATLPLTPCTYQGSIPSDLAGGEYVRNGGNPLANDDLARDTHWFDGDGMLSGVLFRRKGNGTDEIQPEFVNQYLMTDVYRYAKNSSRLRRPIIPSIATLINDATPWFMVLWGVIRTVVLVMLSRLPGKSAIKKISVANTNVIYHDGRALATCESGPPLRFSLPDLQTIGWFNGRRAENEPAGDARSGFGGSGLLSFMKEWTTGHPRVDPVTGELIAFHSTFAKPYVRYSIVNSARQAELGSSSFDMPVPGVYAPKLMHDFGVSRNHTIIMDLPLVLNPMNHARGLPSLHYDSTSRSRFGVFPRYEPYRVQWFETNPCLIFHTANCWDVKTPATAKNPFKTTVNLLACRLTSASMVFQAGNLVPPVAGPIPPEYAEDDQCRLYFFSFQLSANPGEAGVVQHQWALSAIPFEFPTLAPGYEMQQAQYIYGCSTSEAFSAALGKAAKVDFLAKMDVRKLVAKGTAAPPQAIKGCVDTRTIAEIIEDNGEDDAIKIFAMPKGWFAQEPRFVPRSRPESEDDGWLLSYVFDESQLDESGDCGEDAKSELWIIDAKGMKDIVARVKLPQRVPYGLHGNWFTEDDIRKQRPFSRFRDGGHTTGQSSLWSGICDTVEEWLE
ncbi:retinal pigment epithelial membrane protein [Stachybotrys elegans]|uniref:Retinal pigment epithelial membrane protein n=1 Tax=Stachybotrys elegans TaxID=80388 RepID=A0A8K0SPU8_9HYPO|nr:retinal pigment epithelial membrane protein [Stachybotrys elegans]